MLQTIIAVLVLSAGVIALSRLTVFYYTKKKIEEAKGDLKPSERIKNMEEDDDLRIQYEEYKVLVQEIRKRIRFKIGQEAIAFTFASDRHFNTSSIFINHNGWVEKINQHEYGGCYKDEFKLDADWLIDNEVIARGYRSRTLNQILRLLDSKEGE